jgi:glutathione S-transferase
MELYYSPFACSLASHITMRELGLEAELVAVKLSTKKTAKGDDYFAVNGKGQVPALRLNDGTILTEGTAIIQYLADQNPAAGLLPPVGSADRYRVLEWLNFVATEIHKATFAIMFNPESPPEAKAWARSTLPKKLEHVSKELAGRDFLVGGRFSIADAYLIWALNLSTLAGVELPTDLQRYLDRMKERPAVRSALEVETAAAAALG